MPIPSQNDHYLKFISPQNSDRIFPLSSTRTEAVPSAIKSGRFSPAVARSNFSAPALRSLRLCGERNERKIHRRDTEFAKITQRKPKSVHSPNGLWRSLAIPHA